MANFCSKCGKPVNSDAAFCSNCGANLQTVEVNNAVNNDNTQNSNNNESLTTKNSESNQVTTQTVAQDTVNKTVSEQHTNNQTETKYEEIELPNLLENLEKIEVGTKIKTKGYAHNYANQGYDVVGLFPDKNGLLVRKNLCIDFNALSEEVRKDIAVRLQIAETNWKNPYLDITVEGLIKNGGFLYGIYLEVDEVYYDKSQTIKVSEKSRSVAFWLTFFLGFLGLGRFYLGHYAIGILEIILGLIFVSMGAPLWIIDAFIILKWPTIKDGKGNYVL